MDGEATPTIKNICCVDTSEGDEYLNTTWPGLVIYHMERQNFGGAVRTGVSYQVPAAHLLCSSCSLSEIGTTQPYPPRNLTLCDEKLASVRDLVAT